MYKFYLDFFDVLQWQLEHPQLVLFSFLIKKNLYNLYIKIPQIAIPIIVTIISCVIITFYLIIKQLCMVKSSLNK